MSGFNLADLFESVVDVVPDRIALVCAGRRLTYAKLDERANRLAHHLLATGVAPGEHVGVHLYNAVEYLECMLAAFKVRAVPVSRPPVPSSWRRRWPAPRPAEASRGGAAATCTLSTPAAPPAPLAG